MRRRRRGALDALERLMVEERKAGGGPWVLILGYNPEALPPFEVSLRSGDQLDQPEGGASGATPEDAVRCAVRRRRAGNPA